MLSAVLFITFCVAFVGSISYLIIKYNETLVQFWDTISLQFQLCRDSLPDWLLPFAAFGLCLAVAIIIVKLL